MNSNVDFFRTYDPLDDFLFAGYMASKGCEKQLNSLINGILTENNEDSILELEIISNKLLPGEIEGNKSCILDLRSISPNGPIINIEVQKKNENHFRRRSQLYISREFSNSIKSGKLEEVKPHLLINILDFGFCKNDKITRKFNMIDETDIKCVYSDCIKIINVNLVSFRKLNEIDFDNPLHRWLIFLNKNSPMDMVKMVINEDEAIKLAHEKAEELLKDEAFLHEKNKRQQADLKYKGEMDYVRDEGIKEGIREGIKEGIREGIKEGREKGELNIAKKLIEAGMSIEEIAKTTGLSIAKLEKL